MNEKMYEICETHGRMRCGECRYVEELEERLERYEKALKKIVDWGVLGGTYTDIAAAITFQRIARQALEEDLN